VKSKKSVYFLLPLVLLVWGVIGWRIWAATGEPAAEANQGLPLPLSVKPLLAHPRPVLLLTYGDPFKPAPNHAVSSFPQPPSSGGSTPGLPPPERAGVSLNFAARPAVPAVAAAPVAWPQIKYLGVIAHAGSNTQVALLTIDNQELVLKMGKSERGVQVLKLFRDSVQLGYNGQKKSFARGSTN
jgi:hypothetical protein